MGRGLYIYNQELKKVIPIEEHYAKQQKANEAHYFLNTDEIDPVESYASDERKIFTSKSALRRHYKEHGYEDTGGSHILSEKEHNARRAELRKEKRKQIEHDVAVSLNKIKWGMAPMTEKEKHICNQEERNYNKWKKNKGRR